MSDWRRFRWRSGRLTSTPINDGWAIDLDTRDPSIPNLPLETPASSGSVSLSPLTAALSFSAASPQLSYSYTITSSTAQLLLAGQFPTQYLTFGTPLTGSISFSGSVPVLPRVPGTAGLFLQGYSGSMDHRLAPGLGGMVITGLSPTMDLRVGPLTTALSLSGSQPTVREQGIRIPNAATVSMSGLQAAATQQGYRTPSVQALVMAGATPTLLQTAFAAPLSGVMTFQAAAPYLFSALFPNAGALQIVGQFPDQYLTSGTPQTGALIFGMGPLRKLRNWL